jgi:hypothetical protein
VIVIVIVLLIPIMIVVMMRALSCLDEAASLLLGMQREERTADRGTPTLG